MKKISDDNHDKLAEIKAYAIPLGMVNLTLIGFYVGEVWFALTGHPVKMIGIAVWAFFVSTIYGFKSDISEESCIAFAATAAYFISSIIYFLFVMEPWRFAILAIGIVAGLIAQVFFTTRSIKEGSF